MTIAEIQQEIMRMKKEQDICILAHAYQGQEILEVADYMGDSYGLSVQASKSDCKGVIMCGVRFMAETCKVLSPDKKVWLANPAAGCPMAEQLDLEGLRELKAKYPDYAVVASIGTAGVPGAGMVMLAMVLTSVGLPVDGIALVAGVDRIFDMGRTVVNITGDASCCIVVSNLEKKREARKSARNA